MALESVSSFSGYRYLSDYIHASHECRLHVHNCITRAILMFIQFKISSIAGYYCRQQSLRYMFCDIVLFGGADGESYQVPETGENGNHYRRGQAPPKGDRNGETSELRSDYQGCNFGDNRPLIVIAFGQCSALEISIYPIIPSKHYPLA